MATLADRPRLAVASAGVALALAVGGCVSTEQKAAWAHVQDLRIIASQSPTVVRRPGSDLRVTAVTLLRAHGRLAIVVALRNLSAHAVSDVPISVGLRGRRGARTYLNRAAGTDYFKTHVAVVPARGSETWVFTARAPSHLTGAPFALAGDEPSPPITEVRTIPQLRAVLVPLTSARRHGPRLTVTNLSSIPQTQLQVYGVALAHGRYTAAGSATIGTLGTGNSTTTQLHLVGQPSGGPVRLEVLPTMF